ncbi:hypothetical protein CFP56_039251 [Quercus suber]|uniref:Uncharacterized protein n=1 Tax=Quercus suber TaxID=58331 RepID=A0AAW0J176_QUESU
MKRVVEAQLKLRLKNQMMSCRMLGAQGSNWLGGRDGGGGGPLAELLFPFDEGGGHGGGGIEDGDFEDFGGVDMVVVVVVVEYKMEYLMILERFEMKKENTSHMGVEVEEVWVVVEAELLFKQLVVRGLILGP